MGGAAQRYADAPGAVLIGESAGTPPCLPAAASDVELWIGGSITDYGPEGFTSTARYYAKKESLLIAISIPKAMAAASPQERPDQVVQGWLAEGFSAVKLPRGAQKLPLPLIAETVRSSLGIVR